MLKYLSKKQQIEREIDEEGIIAYVNKRSEEARKKPFVGGCWQKGTTLTRPNMNVFVDGDGSIRTAAPEIENTFRNTP